MSYAMKRRGTVLAVMISVLLVAGVAFAAWTSTATGDGSATSFDHTDTLTGSIATDTAGSNLYPGESTDVVVTVTNNQEYPVVVNSISAGESNLIGDCAKGSVDSAAQTLGGTGDKIDAGASKDYTLVATMDTGAAENCAGQTFTIPVTASLSSH